MASVPEALNANAKPVRTMAEQKESGKLHAQVQREIKARKKSCSARNRCHAAKYSLITDSMELACNLD
jgi:hypothetical protein